MRWISVKDALPRKNWNVLLRGKIFGGRQVVYEGYLGSGDGDDVWYDWAGEEDDGVEVTDWMPIP